MRTVSTILGIALSLYTSAQTLNVIKPQVEYKDMPIGIDSPTPRFSWQCTSTEPNTMQTSYHITVKDDDNKLVWDSGVQQSDQSIGICYGGETLEPEHVYDWQVVITDNHNNQAQTSSRFETAISDWGNAKWIGSGDEQCRPFYSHYFPVFNLAFELSMSPDCKSTDIIYGANDPRLMDPRKNMYGIAMAKDESYITLNFSHDSLRVVRHGYTPSDIGGLQIASFAMPADTDWSIGHKIKIHSVSGITVCYVDSVRLGEVNVNPVGRGGDYLAFPVVGDVGYSIDEGSATITDFRIENYRSPNNTLATLNIGTVTGAKIVELPQTGSTMLRREFAIKKPIRKARLYATARGIYDFFINGHKVSDEFFNPGLTQYNKTHLYQIYDVTQLLHKGQNAAGAILNEGWWSGAASFDPANWNWFGDSQSLLCLIRIEYDDGSIETIVSDPESWKTSTNGPVRYSSLFQGEIYDARKCQNTWSNAGFDDVSWSCAKEISLKGVVTDTPVNGWPLADDYSQHTLRPGNHAGVSPFVRIKAQSVTEPAPQQYVYDMGQNFAGIPSIKFRRLRRGQKVVLRYAEVLYPDHPRYDGRQGLPMVENIRAAMAQDIYIASGDSIETFTPTGTYHGYRYIEITGIDHALAIDDVESVVLSSVDRFTSDFVCSDTLVNRLVNNVRYSTLSNVFSIPTDCPQRNERMGWSGDVSVFAPAMSFLFDARDFLSRHTTALRDTRDNDGIYAPIAPMGGGFGGPLWQSAGIVIPWQIYLQYGDIAAVRDNYPAMKQYIAVVLDKYIDKSDNHFRGTESWVDLGDWLGPQCNQNDKTLIFDSYLSYELELMEKMAHILGLDDDADFYARQRAERVNFINESYVNGHYLTGRGFGPRESSWTGPLGGLLDGTKIEAHTSYAVPLALNVFDDSNRIVMSQKLLELASTPSTGDDGRIYPAHSLMTGFVGTPWILYALTDNDNVDEAYSILLSRTYPSWLYPVTLGATSVWERLNSMTAEDGFGNNNGMNSFNHYAFGCVYDWLLQRAAGIVPDPVAPGFKHFYLKPMVDSNKIMTHVKAHYDSPHGRIESAWKITGNDSITYDFVVPANTTATIILPDGMHKVGSGIHSYTLPFYTDK